MQDPHAASEPPPDANSRTWRSKWWAWAVGGLLIGLIGGGVIVAVFDITGNDTARTVQQSIASPTPSPTPSVTSTAGGTVQIDRSCLRAISDAQEVQSQLGELASAASHLDAAALDQAVRRLQQLEQSLSPAIKNCRATVAIPSLPPPSPTAAPSSEVSSASPAP